MSLLHAFEAAGLIHLHGSRFADTFFFNACNSSKSFLRTSALVMSKEKDSNYLRVIRTVWR